MLAGLFMGLVGGTRADDHQRPGTRVHQMTQGDCARVAELVQLRRGTCGDLRDE
jgi:hypothetical protein